MPPITFIAVDWGSSSFRAWAMDPAGHVLEARNGPDGLKTVENRDFSGVITRHCAAWLDAAPEAPVLMQGMVGARTGWIEAAYAPCPVRFDQLVAQATHFEAEGRRMAILPGATVADASGGHDVMRGEEVQIFGAAALTGHDSARICIPGTHSKWASLEAGALTGFRTFVTGELYQILLRNSLVGALAEGEAPHDAAFRRGLDRGAALPAVACGLCRARQHPHRRHGPRAGGIFPLRRADRCGMGGAGDHRCGAPNGQRRAGRALRHGAQPFRHPLRQRRRRGSHARRSDSRRPTPLAGTGGGMSRAPELTLNHVGIAAPEPERSMAFYAAFGFAPGFQRRDAAGRIELQQMWRGAVFVELLADKTAGGAGHFGLHTPDLKGLLRHLGRQGIAPLDPPRPGASGVLWTFFEDPAGNLVEVTSPWPA